MIPIFLFPKSIMIMLGPAEFVVLIVSFIFIYASLSIVTGARIFSFFLLLFSGLFIGTIGTDMNTGNERFTLGFDFLKEINYGEIAFSTIIGSMSYFLFKLIKLKQNEFPFVNEKYKKYYYFISLGFGFAVLIFFIFLLYSRFENYSEFNFYLIGLFLSLGIIMRFYHLPLLPFIYGLLMVRFLEENFVRGLLINRGKLDSFLIKMAAYWGTDLFFLCSCLIFILAIIWRRRHEKSFEQPTTKVTLS